MNSDKHRSLFQQTNSSRLLRKIALLFLLSLSGWYACQNGESSDNAATLPLPPNHAANPPSELSAVFNPITGVVRGFDWNNSPEEVQKGERATPLDSTAEPKTLAFTLDLSEEEFADITYRFKDKKLVAIQLDIYPKDKASTDKYVNQLSAFFDSKYKKRAELWEGSEKEQIFTVFLTQKNIGAGPFVTVIWEKEEK